MVVDLNETKTKDLISSWHLTGKRHDTEAKQRFSDDP